MNTQIFTGNAGAGISVAAAAHALDAAQSGQRTLLLSFGSTQSLGALLGTPVSREPTTVAANLDAVALDAAIELSALWRNNQAQLPESLARLPADDLPLLPGTEALLALVRLNELAPRYGRVVVDAGPHETVLRTLALPDSVRWGVRLLFGLERGPGSSAASVGRALLPTTFLPLDVRNGAQSVRLQAEAARSAFLEQREATACYVLRPDASALADARVAVPALFLHGLPVTTLLLGPVLPADTNDARLGNMVRRQTTVRDEARAVWPGIPLHSFAESGDSVDELRALGASFGIAPSPYQAPISYRFEDAPAVAIALPGMPKDALQLSLSGDELIIRVGPYRRHILLPDELRGVVNIRATRNGEQLVVRRR